jgi:hypothetical protein
MTTATLINQHDYMTVKAKFSKEVNANLTYSRYRMKLSGKGLTIDQMHALLNPFDAIRQRMDKKELPEYPTVGDMMNDVRRMAEQSPSVDVFVAKLMAVATK